MALFSVKLKVDYTVELLVEDAESADDAMKRAARTAADAIETAFMVHSSPSAIGESKAISAVCVNSLE